MTAATATTLGIAEFDLENLGTEVWLCEHPAEALEAFGDGRPDKQESLTTEDGACALDLAAAAGGKCIVLRAHWGNDIPSETDEAWLADVLSRTVAGDRSQVEELVREWWD